MPDPKPPHPSEDADDVIEPGLAPSLCGSCWWGRVVEVVRPLDPDEVAELPDGSPLRGASREISFCRSPSISGTDELAAPERFDDAVRSCEAYHERGSAERLIEASQRKAKKRRASARAARRGRPRR